MVTIKYEKYEVIKKYTYFFCYNNIQIDIKCNLAACKFNLFFYEIWLIRK